MIHGHGLSGVLGQTQESDAAAAAARNAGVEAQ